MNQQTVFESLQQSHAHLHHQCHLPSGAHLAYWSNHKGQVAYHADQVHTLSLYTQGGDKTWRLDKKQAGFGQTGALCIIPEGQQSLWEIQGNFRFLHVYFSDTQFKAFVARTLDIEPRLLEMPDLTYQAQPELTTKLQLLNQNCLSTEPCELLDAEAHLQSVFLSLAQLQSKHYTRKLRLKGGLSSYDKHRIKRFIQEHLSESLNLKQLANEIGLSEYHFARVFRQSFFQSVQQYIERERIGYAKRLLTTPSQLAEIALQCGFANQSHFSRVFKKHTWLTPKQYQRLSH